jgi:hypothetical protein
MGAIGLNPIRLDRIGLDPIRINAIKLGVPGAASGTDRPYIDPEVLASLKAVCICYGKSNDDPDRAVVKNLVDPDNPFIISNAAFKLNSGFGKYEITFQYFPYTENITNVSDSKVVFGIGGQLLIPYPAMTENIPSFKIKVSGLSGTYHFRYYYRSSDGVQHSIDMAQDGYYELPICYNVQSSSDGTNCGFANNGNDVVTITQIPSFEGAFVTDGIDDLITSTKTVQDMLGGSNECTVLSMMCQIGDTIDPLNRNNWLLTPTSYLESRVEKEKTGKTGIYGYTSTNISNGQISNINTILGDKNDYTVNSKIESTGLDYFSVEGFQNEGIWYTSSVAWYWTVIANKVLTTDQINQVIAYFNLDRTLNPDILCNTIKQGITNENHAEFGDRLIDFSGNGRDIQLNNLAWDGDSGIGKYNYPNWKVTATVANTYFTIVNYPTVNGTYSINVSGVSEMMKSIGLHLELRWTTPAGWIYIDIKQDGVYSFTPPDGATDLTLRFGGISGIVNEPCNITITQIPSHAGALYLDGINDFGKVTGMPVYKDYTVVTDREIFANIGAISSKNNPGAFVEIAGDSVYSFGQGTSGLNFISTRSISYLSKYSYCGQSITAGAAEDGTDMWLGTIRDNDTRFFNGAIYSLMTFPYSMSEFLIERQLKKHKLGTLYPDMVEFRPIVKSNSEYQVVDCYIDTLPAVVGNYYPINSKLRIAVTTKGAADEVTSLTVNGVSLGTPSVNGNRFTFNGTLSDKSPQKINITIDEYIRYEDIVQPYPSFVKLENLDRTYTYTWGDKLKVGDTIRYNSSVNLLEGAYTLKGQLECNGVYVYDNNQYITVAKEMIFAWTNSPIWSIDNNEPKCILSPRLLRIPNSSYKILGYIPDISGHGNHGVIHNSAYAEGSGVNEDGSYQFDGVNDFVTIPTTVGGKQMLMKVNWNSLNHVLYDQRNNAEASFCIVTASGTIAYNQRNVGGNTYIDGILNNHILVDDLQAITHNIVLNNDYNVANSNSFIGTNYTKSIYAKMSLYDFMLFDNISTDDKIKELNEYVGIQGNVWRILTQLSNSTLISNETLIKNE